MTTRDAILSKQYNTDPRLFKNKYTGIKFSREKAPKTSYMKKNFLFFSTLTLAIAVWSCNDNNTTSDSTSDDTVNNMNTPSDTIDRMRGDTANTNSAANTTPFNKEDSMFVMTVTIN